MAFIHFMIWQREITIPSKSRGIHLITNEIARVLPAEPDTGILHIFIQHSSAGLTLNENADPTVRKDMAEFFDRMVPWNQSWMTHLTEGGDDMPAHIQSTWVGHSLTIPISGGRMNLGIWQGIYLCEFRLHGGQRRLVLSLLS